MPITASPTLNPTLVPAADPVQRVELRCYSYEYRAEILMAMLEALDQCGCWLESRRPISRTQVEVCFAVPLGGVDELYGGLISAGVEMTRDTHLAMTWLCTLRRHRKERVLASSTVAVRMELNFLIESEAEMGFVAIGVA